MSKLKPEVILKQLTHPIPRSCKNVLAENKSNLK